MTFKGKAIDGHHFAIELAEITYPSATRQKNPRLRGRRLDDATMAALLQSQERDVEMSLEERVFVVAIVHHRWQELRRRESRWDAAALVVACAILMGPALLGSVVAPAGWAKTTITIGCIVQALVYFAIIVGRPQRCPTCGTAEED